MSIEQLDLIAAPPSKPKKRRKREPTMPPPSAPEPMQCPACGAPVLLARPALFSNGWQLYDNHALTVAGETQAILAGVRTVTLHRPHHWPEWRDSIEITHRPANTHVVLAEHACGRTFEHRGPAIPPRAETASSVDDRPPRQPGEDYDPPTAF